MRDFFWDDLGMTVLGFISAVLLVIALAVAAGIYGIYALERQSCYSQLTKMDRNGDYGFWTGCMIELKNGERIPLDNFRGFTEDK